MARSSESAPTPAPPAPEAAPARVSTRSPAAKAMGIPDFDQGSPQDAPVSLAWDDYDANDGGGMPAQNGPAVNVTGTSIERPDVPKPAGDKVKVDTRGTDAEEDHLQAPGDETPVTVAADAPAKPSASERRRAAMEALSREQQTRSVETSLIAERAGREKAEKLLKEGSLGDILKATGRFDRDGALEALIAGKEGETPASQVDGDPKVAALQSEVAALRKKDEARDAEAAAIREARQLELVAQHAQAVPEAKIVHAAIKAGTVVDWDTKTGKPLGASEVIGRVAEAQWLKDGSPAGKQKDYVRRATEALEEELLERHDALAAAVAEKRGDKPAPTPTTPIRQGITRRVPARPMVKPAPLPRDRDQLDAEIKKRFNLR